MHIRISVPGRTELAGNHTDHQGGRVLAAAVDRFLTAEAEKTSDSATVSSAGFPPFSVSLRETDAKYSAPGTSEALLRGVLDYLKREGYPVGGFRAEISADLPAGAGLSSSAAFGVLMGRIVSEAYADGGIPALTLAKAAQYAENVHFGKPCGLMDQCAVAFRGVSFIDFRDADPIVETIHTALFAPDYRLLTVDAGGSHADLTADYAAIPADMKAVAAQFGKSRLRDVPEEAFRAALPKLREACGDRAALRTLHFYGEERRVPAMAAALRAGRREAYLHMMNESGHSSAEFLQNCFSPSHTACQSIPLALSLCRDVLGAEGAARVHGGGFAGMVQVLCPAERVEALKAATEPVFGLGCVRELHVV